jgi:transposase
MGPKSTRQYEVTSRILGVGYHREADTTKYQQEVTMQSVYYVGMDVHKDSVRMAILKDMEKTTVYEATFANDIPRIVKTVGKYATKGQVIAGYEAGCMGYTLQRSLAAAKIDCRVIAANKVPRLGSEKIKTDARDAVLIARMLKNNEGESIYIPTADDEAARDLIRCREDLKAEQLRTKQQLSKFLLRLGFIYERGKSPWTKAHREWMLKLDLEHAPQRECFDQYYCHLLELENRIERIEAMIGEVAGEEPYCRSVARLRCFKGIDTLTALALVCEVGDFRRFPSAAAFMAYLGLVPSEYSSGGKRRQGGITKTGNSHLRKLLIESSWQYRYRGAASVGLKARRAGMDEQVITYSDKALHRLQSKFARLVLKNKSPKTAVAATARELAGFVWGVMTEAYC